MRPRLDASRAFLLAWRLADRLPEDVVRGAMLVAAVVAGRLRGAGVRRLEANLRRARPDADEATVRRLAREGMRTYLRYYAEAFTLGGVTEEQVLARVRTVGEEAVQEQLAAGRGVVLALGHQGNWDLAGAWASRHLAPVTTVAERLEPPEVFEEFVHLRESHGMTIIPLDAGSDVFRSLISAVRGGGVLVPLLADRDLTARGVEVDLLGERARVAAGPAALAVSTGAPLFATSLRHERLHGARRRAAGARWGLVITFRGPIAVPDDVPRPERVARVTQAWVDLLGRDIAEHPTHWHMLQRVFVADLDPERYAATRAADAGTTGSAAPSPAAPGPVTADPAASDGAPAGTGRAAP